MFKLGYNVERIHILPESVTNDLPPPQHKSALPTWGFISTQFKSLSIGCKDTRCALPWPLSLTFISEMLDSVFLPWTLPAACLALSLDSMMILSGVRLYFFCVMWIQQHLFSLNCSGNLQSVICLLALLCVSWGRSLYALEGPGRPRVWLGSSVCPASYLVVATQQTPRCWMANTTETGGLELLERRRLRSSANPYRGSEGRPGPGPSPASSGFLANFGVLCLTSMSDFISTWPSPSVCAPFL